ncbi:MAG: fibronectin type III-like domain-contianing protein [Arachnia sp.]
MVQVYAAKPDSAVDRPQRWLIGSALVRLDPGSTTDAVVEARVRDLGYFADGAWHTEPGRYTLFVGTSAAETPLSVELYTS